MRTGERYSDSKCFLLVLFAKFYEDAKNLCFVFARERDQRRDFLFSCGFVKLFFFFSSLSLPLAMQNLCLFVRDLENECLYLSFSSFFLSLRSDALSFSLLPFSFGCLFFFLFVIFFLSSLLTSSFVTPLHDSLAWRVVEMVSLTSCTFC